MSGNAARTPTYAEDFAIAGSKETVMYLEQIKTAEEEWKERHKEEISQAEALNAACEDGIPLKVLYTPSDSKADYYADVGFPGDFPFTRGNDAAGYRKKLWTISHYAGL